MSKDALALLEALVIEFPGLIDGGTEVNGADLVESITFAINSNDCLLGYLANYGATISVAAKRNDF